MPGKVKVKIVAGRNLPVMDRSSDTTDAFVEIKLGEVSYKTDVFRKSLNPAWNSEWFRFEADDLELQDEPLQVRIMDYDAYSANDAVGKVYIDLNPLLLPSTGHRPPNTEKLAVSTTPGGSMMSGWVPIFDTMHGIRGELNIIVKVELFSDLNRFRQSSCGVHFFCTPEVPEGYKIQFLPGFVEELVANDDPEYKWIDKIRTPRASNEARQLLFMKLSGEVRRKIGLKALDLGANAVIGYKQLFDLEGESGIVVRGIGTAVTLARLQPEENLVSQCLNPSSPRVSRENSAGKEVTNSPDVVTAGWLDSPPTPGPTLHSAPWTPATSKPKDTGVNKLEIDIGASARSVSAESGSSDKMVLNKPSSQKAESPDMTEFPFLTMTRFPPGFIQNIGGMVSAKSVKLLEELDDREDGDTREQWWSEIRQEVRSHARALGCNIIFGYQEKTVIWDDVIILSGSGTGAISSFSFGCDLENSGHGTILNLAVGTKPNLDNKPQSECQLVHIPYSESSVPFPIKLGRCNTCERGKVPDILLTTIEPPLQLEMVGRGGMIQARVLKLKKDLKNENNAREVSDALPFMEYEIHRQIVNKLKVNGMNAIFGLQVNLSLSDRTIIALATGTAVYLAGLPAPVVPKITSSSNMFTDQNHLSRVQATLHQRIQANKEYYGVEHVSDKADSTLELEDSLVEMELSTGNKDTCVLEVDDAEDADIVEGLLDTRPPPGVQVVTVRTPIGLDTTQLVSGCQAFTQIARGKQTTSSRDLGLATRNLLTSTFFKLRKLRPCLLSSLQWEAKVDEEGEVQLNLSGVVIKLQPQVSEPAPAEAEDNPDTLMFRLEEDQDLSADNTSTELDISRRTVKPTRMPQYFLSTQKDVFGINITPLPFVPGARVDHHLGNLNFFFIRESTSVRECGGISTFVQGFMAEVLGILRAHVASLGGNAVISYFMSECILSHTLHKNQAQCLINIGGDCVFATYVTQSD